MGLLRGMHLKAAELRQFEEQLFALVALEVETNDIRPGLWAKAFSEADGDESRTRAGYLKLRVQSLKDELLQLDDALQAVANRLKEYGYSGAVADAPKPTVAQSTSRTSTYAQTAEEKAWFDEQERLAKATRS